MEADTFPLTRYGGRAKIKKRLRLRLDSSLKRVLLRLAGADAVSAAELTAACGLALGKTEGLLRLLASQGYVEEVPGGGCGACPLKATCSGTRWRLTPKGERAIGEVVKREEAFRIGPR